MLTLHFRQLDYRSAQKKAVLATYSSYSTTCKPAPTLARLPYSTPQSTNYGIDMDTDDAREPVVERRSEISGVIHFAAYKSVEEIIGPPLRYYNNIFCGLVGFLGMLEEFGIENFCVFVLRNGIW
jgi:UDP-glucose 4-epimerase